MIDATIPSLPVPLLLLIHLQILQYPKINDAEFDLYVFDSQKRELRARIKTMEELSYWLVGKIERAGVKKILPTYPCLKPAETTAFRTSFSKYLETLRQNVIRDNTAASVWWRDIQVRKSLLEECAGDKFLRLLVALSTHVMVTQTRVKAEADIQPQARPDFTYAKRLAFAQSSQRKWMNTALELLYREQRLANLRAQLVSSTSQSQRKSRYESLSTSRLVALRNSKLQDLLRRNEWRFGDVSQGRKTLMFFVGLTGLSHDPDAKLDMLFLEQRSVPTHCSNLPITPVQPQVLPVAAAHHPEHLRRLAKRVFQTAEAELIKANSSSASANLSGPASSKYEDLYTYATYMLRDYHEAEEHAHNALGKALRRVGEEKHSLGMRLQDEVKRIGSDMGGRTGRSKSSKGDSKTTRGLKAGLRLKTNSVKVKVKIKSVDIGRDFSFWDDQDNCVFDDSP